MPIVSNTALLSTASIALQMPILNAPKDRDESKFDSKTNDIASFSIWR